ncbi:coadhesin-like [Hydractinia symbiolongicarpus]|uniref:coadhesin-like n=1 Tax=Hydractinia symbiolongicarpus TaxID=13093 RepID=UPI00254AB168|nr:coadhesin-like [Hydractinia symbiolongicarpus]
MNWDNYPTIPNMKVSLLGDNKIFGNPFFLKTVTPGTWSPWSIWSNCDKTCGNGTQTRNRTCSPLSHVCELTNGSYSEQEIEGRKCFSMVCNINGGWGPWVTISGCSANCGGGVYTQERDCNSPQPKGLGNPCEFSTYDGHGLHENRTVSCNTEPCTDVSIWGEWTAWSNCFPNCANGHRHRNRTCIVLADSIGCLINGTHSMNDSEREVCSIATCPVNGSWSQWNSWSGCLKTCDNGTRYRTRQCSSPAPKYGGVKCKGIDGTIALEEVGLKYCHNDPCFRFGGWSKWRNVTECSITCGFGTFVRKRYCNNPTPIGQGGLCIDMNNKPVLHELNTVGCSLGER